MLAVLWVFSGVVVRCSTECCFPRVLIQREAADQIVFGGRVQAPQQLHSLVPDARRGLQV
jgi:hypothetical protein